MLAGFPTKPPANNTRHYVLLPQDSRRNTKLTDYVSLLAMHWYSTIPVHGQGRSGLVSVRNRL